MGGSARQGPNKYILQLHHQALRDRKSDRDMYASKLSIGARALLIGSAEFGADDMSTKAWGNTLADVDAAASWGTNLGYKLGTVVARDGEDKWSVKIDDGDFTEGRRLDGVDSSRLLGGTRERVLINPGTSVDTLVSHVRLMWPESISDDCVQIEVSGTPVSPGDMVSVHAMLAGKFAVRINGGAPIRCQANPNLIGWFASIFA